MFGLVLWGGGVVGLDAFSGWVGLPLWCGVHICTCMCIYVYIYIYIYINLNKEKNAIN